METNDIPIVTEETAPVVQNKKKDIWIIAGVVVVIGIIGLFAVRNFYKPPTIPIVVREETPTPSPTPVRSLSQIATQSAFIALEEAYSSFSTSLTTTNLDDPSLSPPTLDLPLGFTR